MTTGITPTATIHSQLESSTRYQYERKWDPGENFNDLNSNGKYDGREFFDLSNNGTADLGLSTIFKSGAEIPNWGKSLHDSGDNYSYIQGLINWNANGYRLPDIILARKLLTGGSHKKKWPWGDALDPVELNAQVRASISHPNTLDQRLLLTANLMASASKTYSATQPNGARVVTTLGMA